MNSAVALAVLAPFAGLACCDPPDDGPAVSITAIDTAGSAIFVPAGGDPV